MYKCMLKIDLAFSLHILITVNKKKESRLFFG